MLIGTLRTRLLAVLAASGVACGGSVATPAGGSGAGGSSGASSGGSSSWTTPPPSTGSTTPPPAPPPSATCAYGEPETACYTHAALESQWKNPPRGGDTGGPIEPPWDANGCLPAADVRDDCCNVAVAGPTVDATGKCCYVHCTGACCGRPFVVDGEARTADVVERADWLATSDSAPASDSALDAFIDRDAHASTRERIAAAWARDAAMEHASVGAFARFALELLAHGAPAALLLDAQAAMHDEIEHARACFAIASRYAGRALGPSALDVAGADANRALSEVVAAVVIEGCVGETLSAVLADARRVLTRDADVRAALARIAEDEARHAELAWRFVAWALARGGAPVRAAVRDAFDQALACPPEPFDASLRGLSRATLRAHGLLDAASAEAAVARALTEVVAPCARVLANDRAA